MKNLSNLNTIFLILVIIILFSNKIYAQEEFSFQLYFEDALGFKDTVTLGYDTSATSFINNDLGEENIINQPWGDSLDVRIGNKIYHQGVWYIMDTVGSYQLINQNNLYQTKSKFLPPYCVNEPTFQITSIQVTVQFFTNNFPLTVSWDKNLFNQNNTCVAHSIFFGEVGHYHLDVAGNLLLYYTDSIVIPASYNVDYFVPPELPSYIEGNKKIGLIQFAFIQHSTVGVVNTFENKINVYPNPIASGEYLKTNTDGDYIINDLNGRLINSGKIINQQIPTYSMDRGCYLLQIFKENLIYNTKIIVR